MATHDLDEWDVWDDWPEEFLRTLKVMSARKADDPERQEWLTANFERLVEVIEALQALGLNLLGSAEYHPAPPEHCDVCEHQIHTRFFVDGHMGGGMWSNMCANCFTREGQGIGWGIGQLFWKQPDGSWRMIAGHDPNEGRED